MSRAGVLNVFLTGRHVGELERLRTGRVRLRYSGEAVRTWGEGTRLLSYSLPVTSRRIEDEALDAWLDNLLPEGAVRTQLEQEYRVHPGDGFALLEYLGAECAGAVQIVPDDVAPAGRLRPLTAAEVEEIVADLPTLTPPVGEQVSASLGGVQAKVLLTEHDGGWAWPAAGAMSTHLVKPEPRTVDAPIPRIIELEYWAMRVAAAAGLPVAECRLERFGDRLALVVARYDRRDGTRRHQEDFAQALGLRPGAKYEPAHDGPSRLARIAAGPGGEAADPVELRRELLALVTFNVVIGNGDAHAKNYSVFLDDGVFSLAPAYDVAPTYYVNDRFGDLGMRVDGQRRLGYLTANHLVREAVGWGMAEAAARETVARVLDAVEGALPAVPTDELTGPVAERVAARCAELRAGLPA